MTKPAPLPDEVLPLEMPPPYYDLPRRIKPDWVKPEFAEIVRFIAKRDQMIADRAITPTEPAP